MFQQKKWTYEITRRKQREKRDGKTETQTTSEKRNLVQGFNRFVDFPYFEYWLSNWNGSYSVVAANHTLKIESTIKSDKHVRYTRILCTAMHTKSEQKKIEKITVVLPNYIDLNILTGWYGLVVMKFPVWKMCTQCAQKDIINRTA